MNVPGHASTQIVLNALRLLMPYDLQGARKVRIGRYFDGGYVMVDQFDGIDAAYSLGINDDVSWDLDIATRGVPCFQYDPTIESLPDQHPLFHWHKTWIGGVSDAERSTATLEDIIKANGHEHSNDLLLKCDIEEAEWPLLQNTPNRVLRQFRQMVLEIHNIGFLADMAHADNVRRAFLNLTASHHVVHIHGNNHTGWQVVGGVPVPAVIEVTLMRKDSGCFEPSQDRFPTDLDMPCNPNEPDLYIGRWDY